MKILVTGAAGFIASHLVEALLREGHEVFGFDNYNTFYAPEIKRHTANALVQKGCKIVEVDIATDDLTAFVQDVEAVFHCAAQPGLSTATSLESYIHNNLLVTENLLQALAPVKSLQLFVNISSSSVYGKMAVASEDSVPHPISYYGITKYAAEQLVMARHSRDGFPATSFRLFSVYGARERPDKLYPRLIHSIVDGAPFPIFENSWDHKRSFTYVGDIVVALLKSLEVRECIGEIFNIGTESSISTGEAITIVEDLMDKKANYIKKPPRPGDQSQTSAVIDKARDILGYSPDTPFHVGIQSMIEWFETLPDHLRSYYDSLSL